MPTNQRKALFFSLAKWLHVHTIRENTRRKSYINQHWSTVAFLTVESLLVQQEIQLIFKTPFYLQGMDCFLNGDNNNNKLQLEEFFSRDTRLYNPSFICSCAEPEKTVTNLREQWICFIMNLCQNGKCAIVFSFDFVEWEWDRHSRHGSSEAAHGNAAGRCQSHWDADYFMNHHCSQALGQTTSDSSDRLWKPFKEKAHIVIHAYCL